MSGGLMVICTRCGFGESVPVDAWEAMGRPGPAELGWQPDLRGGFLCDANGCADALPEPPDMVADRAA